MSKRLAVAVSFALLAITIVPPTAAVYGQQRTPGRSGTGPADIDQQFVALAEQFPGFGGMFYDQQGRLTVYLQDLSQVPGFERQLGAAVALLGQYDFRALQAWRLGLRPAVLGIEGVVSLDVDETRNRVVIGVDRASGASTLRQVQQAVVGAGVPRGAVVIEQVAPIHRVATLRDRTRPVPGGVQVRFSNFLCTLNSNAFRSGVSGFIVNSHCTDQQGRINTRRPTLYYQPLSQVPEEFIGTERVDPAYFRGGQCPRGARCRFSDSAWAEYDDAGLSGGNTIARTTSRDPLSGSLVIDDANPTFNVTATSSSNTPVGTEVNKIGRTTGWTFGDVVGSCVDTGVFGSNFVLLCQDFVEAGLGSGDSGSPVFVWSGGSNVDLVGILWGGSSEGTLFVYSPYGAVEQELGLD